MSHDWLSDILALYATTEPQRHAAEVKHVLALRYRGREVAQRYLELVADKRGQQAADKLEQDAREEWNAAQRSPSTKALV